VPTSAGKQGVKEREGNSLFMAKAFMLLVAWNDEFSNLFI
jgi:hypothetical protein